MQSVPHRGASLALLFGVTAVLSSAAPVSAAPAQAHERWLTVHAPTYLYSTAEGATVLGFAPQWSGYRLDGPAEAQNGRFFVWSPYTRGRAWIPAAAVGPGHAPTTADIAAFWAQVETDAQRQQREQRRAQSPRDYLYAQYPDLAPRLDCIASRESEWQNVPNVRGSGAFGPFQFLRGTFSSTATGAAGGDWGDPWDQVDAAADMLRAGRAREWAVVARGLC